MKLRLRGDSVRLRLLRSEVQKLVKEGVVRETVAFGAERALVYTLEMAEGIDAIRATLDESLIRVLVPRQLTLRWADSDQVGMTADQSLPDGGSLHLLIEKDFQCLKPRTSSQWEDESDAFPNPNPSCGQPQ